MIIKDYDLNIFQSDDEIATAPSNKWFLDIYEVTMIEHDPHSTNHRQLGMIVELTLEEATALKLGEGYFEDSDNWYGLDGFIEDYEESISPRLWELFNSIPKE